MDFFFLLPPSPRQRVIDYLFSTYGWNYHHKSGRPLLLFVRYFEGAVPESYKIVTERFQSQCVLDTTQEGQKRLLIAADWVEFSRVLSDIKTLSCKKLFREIQQELNTDPSPTFIIRDQTWNNQHPKVMGILNITPDSFYDGGRYFKQPDYEKVAEKMIKEGADIIDIGGESSRPGSQPVSQEEEIARVLPALKQIRGRFQIPISIDTVKPEVADITLTNGADMINDISGLSKGREMVDIVQRHNASYCLMHIQGTPKNMQLNPKYTDLLADVYHFFLSKYTLCADAGLKKNRVLIDPGIGFGKTVSHNLDLLRFLPLFKKLNHLILLGTSNKSFINSLINRDVQERLIGSLATQTVGCLKGANLFRVHNIRETADSIHVARQFT